MLWGHSGGGIWSDVLSTRHSERVVAMFLRSGTAAILLLLVLPGRAWVAPVFTFSMCATGMGNASFWAIAQHVSPANMTGRTIGFLNTLSQVGGIVAPLVTGWSLGPARDFRIAILIAGLCPLTSLVLLVLAGPKKLDQLKIELEGASA